MSIREPGDLELAHLGVDPFNMANTCNLVPLEVRAKYVAIIDDILAHADLTQITEKRIRNGIQQRVEYDITPQKVTAPQTLARTETDTYRPRSRH